ncbi:MULTISPECIES: rubredoxin [Rhodopseudomonas]|uniref:Rubredoxin n=1 Tax=Rhodopseudomonas palustris TaxID=1076 RepID=A0A0D7EZZ3_RHOPL|nr:MULTISPECIES: rubredoxin [Rhodopseudomonas]KIZ45022.1 rubredoxin [Rhodopseudomonas palustris]MDF3809541.1 rubredoxin [Rhodopseudomonas sp. BAL398]WOK17739.1 rubredoxin [Rhodopseudomonas sp. BAL398]
MSSFENFGVREDIADAARMECGICWTVYDPAQGDAVAQIPPGTPFTALPADWTCPNCDAVRGKFMMIEGDN